MKAPPSGPRAGLTLIEVVAALALLTLVAVTCLPLLRRATDIPHAVDRSSSFQAVGRLADNFLAAPEHFGYDHLSEMGYLSGPNTDERDAIGEDLLTFRRLEPRETGIDHHWMAFTRDGVRVFRWVPVTPDLEQSR